MKLTPNPFAAALNSGQKQIGFWISLCSNVAAEVIAHAGFDWALIDMEHAPNDYLSVLGQLQVFAGSDTTALVRVEWNDTVAVKRLLDLGVQGLLFPMIQSVEEAKKAVVATRYPPKGVRGVSGTTRATKFGRVTDYYTEVENQTAILIPKASYDRTFGHYIKYAMRNAMDIATLGTSVNARLSEDKKTFDRVRIAFGVAGPVPMRAPHAEEFINGKPVTLENIEDFGKAVLEDIHPRDSWRASKAFRSHIAVESAKRCLMESVKLAGGEL